MPPNPIMRFFGYEHLPDGEMRRVSRLFGELAREIEADLHPSAETSAALRKLLEAKDCAVRAKMVDIETMRGPRLPLGDGTPER